MNITKELINKLKGYGFHLISIKDKKPNKPEFYNGSGDWSWKKDQDGNYITYSDEELLRHGLGVNHEACSVIDEDFDCDEASKFQHLLPATFTVGSKYNGIEQVRKKIYFVEEGIETEHKSFPSNPNVKSEDGTVVENLAHTQSWIAGGNRFIINDVKPKTLNAAQYKQLKKTIRKIYALSMLTRLYPKKETFRDHFSWALVGCLHHETDWSDAEKEEFVTELCNAAGDKAVKKRLEKLPRVKENIKKGKDGIWKTKKLSELLGRLGVDGGLDFIDAIRKEKPEEEHKGDKSRTIIFHNSLEFSKIEFPKPLYILDPYIREQTITAFIGEQESGKTMTGMRMSASVANAKPFLDATSVGRPRPTLYIEGDLPADDIKGREGAKIDYFNKRGWGWNREYFHLATMQQQMMAGRDGFTPLQSEQGQLEMENAINQIAKRTGQRVYVHFDNISILAPAFEENKAEAWSPLIKYFLKLKNQGHIINYHHHLNKGKDFSGSTMQVRAIDMAIRFQKLDSKHKIEMSGEKNVQCKVDFDIKWRLHGNSKHAKPFILTCDEQQNWKKLPLLDNNEFEIMRLYKDGYNVEEMSKEVGLAEKTIYKKLKKLKDIGIIKDEKSS